MADNFAFTPGSGATGAADDIGGVLYPRVKIAQGADGSATDVSSAAPLQVSLANTGANATAVVVGDGGSTISVDDGASSLTVDNAALSVTGGGVEASAMRVTIANDSTGVLSVDDNGNSITVDNAGTFAVQESGAALTSLQLIDDVVFAEDAASANGDKGIQILTRRTDTAAATSGTDGDYQPLITDSTGKLHVNVGNTVTVASHAVTNAGTFAVQDSEKVADDAAFTIGATKVAPVGYLADSTSTDSVDEGDVGIARMTLDRRQIVQPYEDLANAVSGAITTAMTGTTSTSLVAAPGAGLRNYITTIIVSNAHASVGTDVIIQDGSGGTTLLTIPAAAVYGGAVITLPTPLRQPTTNTALYCANVTTGASTKVSAVGFKAA